MAAIAAEAEVAVSTVSYVLNGKHREARISPARVEQILAIARAQDYRPNAAAVAMRRGRFDAIGLVVNDVTGRHSLPGGFLDAALEHTHRSGLHMVLARLDDHEFTGGDVPRMLREWSVDGLIFNHMRTVGPDLREKLRRERIPGVWVNAKLDGDCVIPDDLAAGRDAVIHLHSLGHREIAYLSVNWSPHFSHDDRLAGYHAGMAQCGLQPQVERVEGREVPRAERLARLRAWIRRSPRPTAVIAYADDDALPLVAAALAEGLRIPEDLSIVTFDDQPVDLLGLAITTWRIDVQEMGRRAVNMLRAKLEDPKRIQPMDAVPLVRHDGATTAPPRSGAQK